MIIEISAVRESVDTGELGEFMPQLRALVAVNPESEHFPVVRVNGITSVMTFPASGGRGGGRFGGGEQQFISGQAALIHTGLLALDCPGFYMQKPSPEVDQFNFAPRVTAPVLMLNGRYDFVYPPDTSQEPMFHMLGAPKEHKRRVVYDTGHDTPRTELIKETLNWLDRYLGPVK